MKVVFRQWISKGTSEEYSYLFEVDLSTISVFEFRRRYENNDTVELVSYKNN